MRRLLDPLVVLLALTACLAFRTRPAFDAAEVVVTGRVVRGNPPVPVDAVLQAGGLLGIQRGDGFLLRGKALHPIPWIEVRCADLEVRRFSIAPPVASGRADLGDLLVGPDGALDLLVTDVSGRPVRGTVALFPATRRPQHRAEGRDVEPAVQPAGRAFHKGAARVDGIPPGAWTVVIEAPGCAPVVRSLPLLEGVTPPAAFVLAPGHPLSGVLRGPDGGPLAGAVLHATPGRGRNGVEPLRRTSVTDAEGRYAFADLPSGEVRVEWAAEGHDRELETVMVPGVRSIDLRVDGSATLSGRVVDAGDGRPVAGAVVAGFVRNADAPLDRIRAITDGNGRYRAEGLTPGLLDRLVVHAEGHPVAPQVDSKVAVTLLRDSATTVVDAALRRGGTTLHGSVRDVAGRPVPWALLSAGLGSSAPGVPVRAGADGKFTLAGLGPGRVRLGPRMDGWDLAVPETLPGDTPSPGSAPLILPERGTVATTITLVRNPDRRHPSPISLPAEAPAPVAPQEVTSGTIVGRVRDGDGRPVPGARVGAWPSSAFPAGSSGDRRWPAPVHAVTSSDGRFEIPGLPPVDHRITVRARGFLDGGGMDVPPREGEVAVVLSRPAFIEGSVVDPEGRPLAGVPVVRGSHPSTGGDGPPVLAWSDDVGRFRIPAVPGRDYSLRTLPLLDRNFVPAHVAPVRAGEGDARLVLAPGRVVSGRVVDDDGRPVPGISLRTGHASGETDGDGRFRLPGLAPGPCVVEQSHSTEFRPEVSIDPVTVEAGREDIVIRGRRW